MLGAVEFGALRDGVFGAWSTVPTLGPCAGSGCEAGGGLAWPAAPLTMKLGERCCAGAVLGRGPCLWRAAATAAAAFVARSAACAASAAAPAATCAARAASALAACSLFETLVAGTAAVG